MDGIESCQKSILAKRVVLIQYEPSLRESILGALNPFISQLSNHLGYNNETD
jgi:hypothetical protein